MRDNTNKTINANMSAWQKLEADIDKFFEAQTKPSTHEDRTRIKSNLIHLSSAIENWKKEGPNLKFESINNVTINLDEHFKFFLQDNWLEVQKNMPDYQTFKYLNQPISDNCSVYAQLQTTIIDNLLREFKAGQLKSSQMNYLWQHAFAPLSTIIQRLRDFSTPSLSMLVKDTIYANNRNTKYNKALADSLTKIKELPNLHDILQNEQTLKWKDEKDYLLNESVAKPLVIGSIKNGRKLHITPWFCDVLSIKKLHQLLKSSGHNITEVVISDIDIRAMNIFQYKKLLPNVKNIKLTNVRGLCSISDITWNKLKTAKLTDCKDTEIIDIIAPQLIKMEVKRCPHIMRIATQSQRLKEFSLTNTHSLNVIDCSAITLAPWKLKKVEISSDITGLQLVNTTPRLLPYTKELFSITDAQQCSKLEKSSQILNQASNADEYHRRLSLFLSSLQKMQLTQHPIHALLKEINLTGAPENIDAFKMEVQHRVLIKSAHNNSDALFFAPFKKMAKHDYKPQELCDLLTKHTEQFDADTADYIDAKSLTEATLALAEQMEQHGGDIAFSIFNAFNKGRIQPIIAIC